MAAVPREQTDNDNCVAIWKIVLRALGEVYQSSSSLGKALATEEFPENRMNRLLTASGTSLPGLIDEALRWLVVHQGNSVDLSVLVTLGVADVLGDTEARDWARKQIALDYVRAIKATGQEQNLQNSCRTSKRLHNVRPNSYTARLFDGSAQSGPGRPRQAHNLWGDRASTNFLAEFQGGDAG